MAKRRLGRYPRAFRQMAVDRLRKCDNVVALSEELGVTGVGMAAHHALAFLLIFLGGGMGSMLRHAVNQASAGLLGVNFPWGTLFVNIIGSLVMGLLAGWFAFRGEGGQLLCLSLATGILGGFTTFSAFSLDAALLWQKGQAAAAGMYVAGSVLAALIGVFAGLAIMRALLS